MTETEKHHGSGGNGPRPQTPEPVSPDSSGPEPPRIGDFAPASGDVAAQELPVASVPPRAVARRWAMAFLGLLSVAIIACLVGLFRLANRGLPPQPVAVAPLVSPPVLPDSHALGEEVLRNPGFEEGLQSWVWPGAWWTFSITIDAPHSGLQAARVSDRTHSWNGIGQSILGRIEPEKVYECAAWVRIENAASATVFMHVAKVDESHDGTTTHQRVASGSAVEGAWTEIRGRYSLSEVSGPLKRLYFYFEGPPPGVNLWVDDVSMKPVIE